MPDSRRTEALGLTEEILGDIELSRVPASDVARKTSRLARLLDDSNALEWLHFEISGYPTKEIGGLTAPAVAAAKRSNRIARVDEEGQTFYWTTSLAAMQAEIEAAKTALTSSGGATAGDLSLLVEQSRVKERTHLRDTMAKQARLIESVVGAFHSYVSARYQELRFGDAVETAFEIVRAEVDEAIASLIPDGLPKLSAALENAASHNPEHWAGAAATCRRLLKAAADALRPPGPDVDGRKMGDENYINRLVDWIVSQAESQTAAKMVAADLDYLGRRLDAVVGAGAKGAHAEVTRFDASRFVTGTYLLLGDVLRFRGRAA